MTTSTTSAPSTVSPTDFSFITALVEQRSAIVLAAGKDYLVQSRLAPLVQELGLGSLPNLVAALRRTPDSALAARVVEAMTTNETFWFRDVHPFTALRQHIIPDLLTRNAATRSLRIWSAACSTGQELYSIAMALDTDFPQLASWTVQLTGTDISPTVIERAVCGRYSPTEAQRGLPAALLARYLHRDGSGYRVSEHLRARTRFSAQNLIEPWPARPPLDVVFLRNVLIYFDVKAKRTILTRVHQVLRPGGYLLLGTGETTLGIDQAFTPVRVAGTVIHQKTG